MPGGAVFSAPMVNELGLHSKLSKAQLSFVNYWFRHIWEHWWPLYPGILLTTVITEISLLTIIATMCPFTVVAIWLGYRALKGTDSHRKINNQNSHLSLWPFIKELVPILLVIFPGLGMGVLFSKLFADLSISKEIGLIFALCLAIAWVWYQNGTSQKQILFILTNPQLLKMNHSLKPFRHHSHTKYHNTLNVKEEHRLAYILNCERKCRVSTTWISSPK